MVANNGHLLQALSTPEAQHEATSTEATDRLNSSPHPWDNQFSGAEPGGIKANDSRRNWVNLSEVPIPQ